MSTQSEAALEAGLIATLQQMDYEYVQIAEEENLQTNFKRQLEKHNKKQLEEFGKTGFTDEEFEKNLLFLEGGTRFEKARKSRDRYELEVENSPAILRRLNFISFVFFTKTFFLIFTLPI